MRYDAGTVILHVTLRILFQKLRTPKSYYLDRLALITGEKYLPFFECRRLLFEEENVITIPSSLVDWIVKRIKSSKSQVLTKKSLFESRIRIIQFVFLHWKHVKVCWALRKSQCQCIKKYNRQYLRKKYRSTKFPSR